MKTRSGPYTFRFSLAERDRRWEAVRQLAAEAGFDAVLVPPCVDGYNLRLSMDSARGTRADSRYFTQMEEAAIILPTDGRAPVIICDERNDWVPEPIPLRSEYGGSWADALIDGLLGLQMDKSRVAVSGLGRGVFSHVRANDGVVCHAPYAAVLARFPNATFEDGTDVVGASRSRKSDEEVTALRYGAAVASAGVETLCEMAHPGVDEGELYSCVMRRMLELGGEYYHLVLVTGPKEGHDERVVEPRPGRRLAPMQIVDNEVNGLIGGLIAQEKQPILLGETPEAWKSAIELQRQLYEVGLEYLKPGNTIGELMDVVEKMGQAAGLKTSTLMHGRGYGNEGPMVTGGDPGTATKNTELRANNVFVWKPIAVTADKRLAFSFGSSVVVTETGAVPLVPRPHGLVCNV